MTTIDFDRNEPLRRALASGPECPPLAELLDVIAGGAAGARAEELRSHAAVCLACSAELELASGFDDRAKSPAETQEIAWVVEQLATPERKATSAPTASQPTLAPQMGRVLPMAEHARRKRSRLSRGSREMSLWNRWAAAALVLVGMGVAFEWAHRSFAPALPGRGEGAMSDVVRSGELRLDSPVGVVAGADAASLPAFVWRPLAGARSYRVEVRDVAGDLLWQGVSDTATLAPPPDLRSKLETLVTYRWSVTALDDAAGAVGRSAAESFRIEPRAY